MLIKLNTPYSLDRWSQYFYSSLTNFPLYTGLQVKLFLPGSLKYV
jgi:hypothetical protein